HPRFHQVAHPLAGDPPIAGDQFGSLAETVHEGEPRFRDLLVLRRNGPRAAAGCVADAEPADSLIAPRAAATPGVLETVTPESLERRLIGPAGLDEAGGVFGGNQEPRR